MKTEAGHSLDNTSRKKMPSNSNFIKEETHPQREDLQKEQHYKIRILNIGIPQRPKNYQSWHVKIVEITLNKITLEMD